MSALGDVIQIFFGGGGDNRAIAGLDLRPANRPPTSERGSRVTPENRLSRLYRTMWVDPDLRQTILDLRQMDREDPRVKRVHGRTSRAAVKGGLRLKMTEENARLRRQWEDYQRRLGLNSREKLESDARGLMMEGSLPLQWVLGPDNRVLRGVRMPSETLLAKADERGIFTAPARAWDQLDVATGGVIASFAMWQLSVVRLTPDNYDDHGSMGRPYLDAARGVWKKLTMTEEDLVVRRRERAPLRTAHVLEGASEEELLQYKDRVEDEQKEITTNYYLNKKGAVSAVQGDASLSEIADVNYLLDTFFTGAPAPKGLFGYADGLSRDILEDLKRDYYDELDAMQDALAQVYQQGFELDLLLQGINPLEHDLQVIFAERRTETPNQAADRALKVAALGGSRTTAFEIAGLDPAQEKSRREGEAKGRDPYPDENNIGSPPRVSITPGNERKGDSGTAISN